MAVLHDAPQLGGCSLVANMRLVSWWLIWGWCSNAWYTRRVRGGVCVHCDKINLETTDRREKGRRGIMESSPV